MSEPTLPLHKRLLAGWMAIVARFGEVQTLVLLGFFYGFLIGPMATAIAVGRGDLLAKRGLRAGGSAWSEADTSPAELERAKHPF